MNMKYLVLIVTLLGAGGVHATIPAFGDQTVQSILDHEVLGSEMAGLRIFTTVDDVTSSVLWDGMESGGLKYSGGDTSVGTWEFTNTTSQIITEILFDMLVVSAVYDVNTPDDPDPNSTPDSHRGRFLLFPGSLLTPAFVGEVSVIPEAAVGDLFRSISFVGDLAPGESFKFIADTDQVLVPLPPALMLFISGLLGLISFRRSQVQV